MKDKPDWLFIDKTYPLAAQALKTWYAEAMSEIKPGATTFINEWGPHINTDGNPLYATTRDLFMFFDEHNIGIYVTAAGIFPQCSFYIRSPKHLKKFDDVYADRIEAEISGFEKAFQLLNNFITKTK